MRPTGALIADRAGVDHGLCALRICRSAAILFVGPGVDVYEGMIIGENSRDNDLDVNIVQGKEADQHAGFDFRRSDPTGALP